MRKILETRSSDSALIQSVTRVKYVDDSIELEPPDGHWAIVVLKHQGKTQILHTGTVTKPVTLRFEKDDGYVGISFKPSTFLTRLPAQQLVDTGIYLPKINEGNFWLGNSVWEIPTFENAEVFANKLVENGLLAFDDIVHAALNGWTKAFSLRSIQRHFLRTTGITMNYFHQIQRAREASSLLQTGSTPIEAALATGYYDQSHMTKSLKKILGKTPTEIIRSGGK